MYLARTEGSLLSCLPSVQGPSSQCLGPWDIALEVDLGKQVPQVLENTTLAADGQGLTSGRVSVGTVNVQLKGLIHFGILKIIPVTWETEAGGFIQVQKFEEFAQQSKTLFQ